MKRLLFLLVLFYGLTLQADSFDAVIDKIKQINTSHNKNIEVKIFAGKYNNHKVIKKLRNILFENNIITENSRLKDPIALNITIEPGKFWEVENYNVTYQIIDKNQDFTRTENIAYLSPYSLYARLFIVLVIIALLFRMHTHFDSMPNFKTLFITYTPALLIIFALIQGYFFVGVV